MSSNEEKADDLEQLIEEIEKLVFDAREIVEEHSETGDSFIAERAKLYWLAHIDSALNKPDWFSAVATVEEIRNDPYEDEDDET